MAEPRTIACDPTLEHRHCERVVRACAIVALKEGPSSACIWPMYVCAFVLLGVWGFLKLEFLSFIASQLCAWHSISLYLTLSFSLYVLACLPACLPSLLFANLR